MSETESPTLKVGNIGRFVTVYCLFFLSVMSPIFYIRNELTDYLILKPIPIALAAALAIYLCTSSGIQIKKPEKDEKYAILLTIFIVLFVQYLAIWQSGLIVISENGAIDIVSTGKSDDWIFQVLLSALWVNVAANVGLVMATKFGLGRQ